jgi:hypothetical protein
MNIPDFSRSFLRWTSTSNNHTPRLQVDAVCTLTAGGVAKSYVLSAMCTGETMYADRDLIHQPADEFAMVFSPSDREFMFFKSYADPELNVHEVHRLGEAMSTHNGKGSPIVEMSVHLAQRPAARRLTGYAEIREAILGDKPLNARTEYLGEDGSTQVVMDYPVKICNIAHGRERWQIDTGPVLLPDFSAKSPLAIGRLRSGYIVFNSWDWAEVIHRPPRSPRGVKSWFTAGRRLTARNAIFCAE